MFMDGTMNAFPFTVEAIDSYCGLGIISFLKNNFSKRKGILQVQQTNLLELLNQLSKENHR